MKDELYDVLLLFFMAIRDTLPPTIMEVENEYFGD